MEAFVIDFRKREDKLEQEIREKDEQIRRLQEGDAMRQTVAKMRMTGFAGAPDKGEELKDNAYVRFVEKRLQEVLQENKRYHDKYADIREFAYSSVESLMR